MKSNMPSDQVIGDLIRFGFRESDIAARFEVEKVYVTMAKKRLGLPLRAKDDPGRFRRNGARLPYKVRLMTPVMERRGNRLVSVFL